MDLKLLVHLIFLCVLNIIFFFSGVVLNTLVIIAILKSPQLRKKLCHFMMMVLSCCDLLTVVTYSSVLIAYFIIRFTEHKYKSNTTLTIYWQFCYIPVGLSMVSLMTMCIERYLGVYYPIFHKTSVTRRRLLILLAIFTILPTTTTIISTNDLVISVEVALSIYMAIFIPPFIFFNYKLFKFSRKMRRQNATSPEKRRKIRLQNVSTCLLAVACLVFVSIPASVYVVFGLMEGKMSENSWLCIVWVGTAQVMNCSFNSLIFFWKNKVLRDKGIKIIKKIKDRVPNIFQ